MILYSLDIIYKMADKDSSITTFKKNMKVNVIKTINKFYIKTKKQTIKLI